MADIKPSILSGISKLFKDILGGTHAEVVAEMSLVANSGGTTMYVSLSTANAQTPVIDADYVVIMVDALTYFRQGVNPVATNTPVSGLGDQPLPANTPMRLAITRGQKLGLILASGTGTAMITPGA